MQSIIKGIDAFTEAVGGLAALIIIPLMLTTCYEVFARYIFGAPTIWAFELGYTLMGFHFLLGGALTLKRGAHIRIDLIYAQLSKRGQALIDLVLYLTLIVPCLWMLSNRLGSYALEAWHSGETTGHSAWNPVIWPLRMMITLSFIFLLLQVVSECLKCVQALRNRPAGTAA